jgi:hypothetical protein
MGLQGPIGPTGATGPAGPKGTSAGSQIWNSFVSALTTPYTVATFTPGTAIVVTRIQAQVSPNGCTAGLVLSLSDGTPSGTRNLSITGLANDTGPMSVNFAAGTPVTLSVTTPAACKGNGNGNGNGASSSMANVVVQYKE